MAFVEFYDKNDKTRATNQRNDYLGLSTTYTINDNWSTNFALEYYNDHDSLINEDREYLTLTLPNIGFSYGDISINAYLAADIMTNKDNKTMIDDPIAGGTVAAEVFYSMF